MGQALLNNFDISKRVFNMFFYSSFFIPLLILLCYIILLFIFRKKKPDLSGDSFVFFEKVTFAAMPALAVLVQSQTLSFRPIVPSMMVVLLLYLRFGEKCLPFIRFKWVFFTSLSMLFFGILLFYKLFPGSTLHFKVITIAVYLILTMFLSVLMFFFERRGQGDAFCAAFTPLAASPIFVSLFIEAVNILNQHDIFVTNKTEFSFGIIAFCAITGAVKYAVNKGKTVSFDMAKWQFPLIVFALAMLSAQPPMQITVNGPEFFETANYGCDIVEFLRYGEIPIVENLNVHMLFDDIGGILYGLFNNDIIGAIYFNFSANAWMFVPFSYLACYLFFTKITDEDNAMFVSLLFPLTGTFGFLGYYGVGLFVVLAAIYVNNLKSFGSNMLLGVACVVLCLHRLDIGLAFGLGAVISLSILFIVNKKWKILGRFWITLSGVGMAVIMVFLLICIGRGIPAIARFREFIDIMTSNVSWAYASFGEDAGPFVLVYLLSPLALMVSVILVFTKRKLYCISSNDCLIIAILAIAFWANYQRSIVRHNLTERQFMILFYTAPLCVFTACYFLIGKKPKMLGLCLGGFLALQPLCGYEHLQGDSLLQLSINKQSGITNSSVYKEKIDRVVLSDVLQNAYMPLKKFFDATLKDDETYFDYTFQTLLYALTERNKPVYVNQSPSQLNGEYAHLAFIAEIESTNCPYALVGSYNNGWDGVPLNINHYLIAEYLNANYRPFYLVGDHKVWVRNDRYEEKQELLAEHLLEPDFKILVLSSDYVDALETYDTKMRFDDAVIKSISGTIDPYADGFQKNEKLRQTMVNSEALAVQIDYTSTKEGTFQCFYTQKDNESYSESQSVALNAALSGTLNFMIPCTEYTHIRFDFPDGSDFVIKEIRYASKDVWDFLPDNYIGYDYDAIPHKYQVGPIPYLWGKYDKAPAQEILKTLHVGSGDEELSELSYDPGEIDMSKGNYIEIVADSDRDSVGTLIVSGDDGDLITVSFNVIAGLRNRYLVRISGDPLWYSGLCKSIGVQSDAKLQNVSVRILRGDTLTNEGNKLIETFQNRY
jgi:hypothetical protein